MKGKILTIFYRNRPTNRWTDRREFSLSITVCVNWFIEIARTLKIHICICINKNVVWCSYYPSVPCSLLQLPGLECDVEAGRCVGPEYRLLLQKISGKIKGEFRDFKNLRSYNYILPTHWTKTSLEECWGIIFSPTLCTKPVSPTYTWPHTWKLKSLAHHLLGVLGIRDISYESISTNIFSSLKVENKVWR